MELNRKRGNRQKMFSFGNIKKELGEHRVGRVEDARTRIETQPEFYQPDIYAYIRQPLGPRNCGNYVAEQHTPSFNFPVKGHQQNRFNRHVAQIKLKCYGNLPQRYQPYCYTEQEQELAKPNYHYNPTIEDITRKYGISQNKFVNESVDTKEQTLKRIPQARSLSYCKGAARKVSRFTTLHTEDSDSECMPTNRVSYDRFTKKHQPESFVQEKTKYCDISYKGTFDSFGKAAQPKQHHQVYPESCPRLFDPSSQQEENNQTTLDSIHSLNQLINQKVNRILANCSDYSYY